MLDDARIKQAGADLVEQFAGAGVVLMVFEAQTTPHRMKFATNVVKADLLSALKEFVAELEGNKHQAPATKQ